MTNSAAHMSKVFPLFFLALLAVSSTALAQDENRSRWGVSFSGTPQWEYLHLILNISDKIAGSSGNEMDIRGSEFTVGIIRGSDNGGDWGVSLVRRTVSDDSIFRNSSGAIFTLHSAGVTGVEVHKYSPYIRTERVQVGLNLAIGVGKVSGTAIERVVDHNGVEWTEEHSASYVLNGLMGRDDSDILPLGRVEAAVGIRATESLKLKVGGGIAFPGRAVFRVGLGYLF
jgi:hypothetical protein